MGDTRVADLVQKQKDATGAEIITIYGRKPPEYAVYRTAERVMVHYADSSAQLATQRKVLARLNPLRGEINGLIDGWRTGSAERRLQTDRYDRRVADALIVALEGDAKGAEALLAVIKQDVLNERVSWARFLYLLSAFATVLVFFLIISLSTWCISFSPTMIDLWRAAAAGAVGAFFSLALSVHSRTILPDLLWISNLVDAALRILIGAIAATMLVCMVRSGAFSIEIGNASPDNPENAWAYVLLAGFLAGFSERLVADLLGQASGKVGMAAIPTSVAKVEDKAVERPAGDVAAVPPPDPVERPKEPDPHHGTDHCAADVELAEDEVTRDEDLPAASGGVAPKTHEETR